MTAVQARLLFESLLRVPDARTDLLRVALAIAAEEDPSLDVEQAAAEVEARVAAVHAKLPPLAPETRRVAALNALVFKDLGLDGAGCDFTAPESSMLPKVLERRTGLPILLALVWVEAGRRLGLETSGVSFPGHFLAKVRLAEGDLVVDPHQQGRVLTDPELHERARKAGVPRWDDHLLDAASPRHVAARLLRNLKNLYAKHRDFPRAFSAVDRLLVATPDSWEDVRDRGLYCEALGGLPAARKDLQRYLDARPDAHDAAAIREKLGALERGRVFLN